MALSKEKKKAVVAQYEEWFEKSEAIVITEYVGINMPQMDELRSKIREVGGEFHVIKNTLGKRAFAAAGLEAPDEYFVNSSAVGIAFDDPPGVAKAIKDFGKNNEFVQIKGGFMSGVHMTADQIKALAELPPLPIVRGQLLGVISAPASKLVRTLVEPGRSLAQVVKAKADASAA